MKARTTSEGDFNTISLCGINPQKLNKMENYKTPEQLFKEEHPEVEKFYILAVTEKNAEDYGNHFYECYAERPTNERADQVLDNLLEDYSLDMYEDDELTLYVDIQEVTVKHADTGDADWDEEHFEDEYVELYTKERTVSGKMTD